MWLDEFFTLYLARQHDTLNIVRATKAGLDNSPPLYAIICSRMLSAINDQALAIRLPSTLGFTGMLCFVLAFCRRFMPALYCFVAAFFLCAACGYYASEGRCYGLVLFFAAAALYCWQNTAGDTGRVWAISLLALCLMSMTALHYYSVFFVFSLAIAEIVRWQHSGKRDLGTGAALLSPLVVLALHYPLIMACRRASLHFWPDSIAAWRQIPEFYLRFFFLDPFLVFFVSLLAVAVVGRCSAAPEKARFLPAEWTAIGLLSVSPVLMVAVAKYTTHIFLKRYALWAVIGLSILSATILYLSSHADPAVGIVALGTLTCIIAGQSIVDFRHAAVLREGEVISQALKCLPAGSEPIVIGYERAFAELSYYSEPPLRERLVYPISESLELRYRGTDVNYLQMSALEHWTNLNIVDLNKFLGKNPHFILATGPDEYLSRYLREAGYRLSPISTGIAPILYEAEAPRAAEGLH